MAVDPASQEGLEAADDAMDMAAEAAELAVLLVIAERLGKVKRGATHADAAEWAILDEQRIDAAMKKGAAVVDAEIERGFSSLSKGDDEWASAYYEASGAIPSGMASKIVDDAKKAAKERARDTLRTSVAGLIDDSGNFVGLYDGYRDAVSRSVAAMMVGDGTYQDEVANAVSRLSRHGVRVRYDSGITRELYAAVRTNVMDTYRTAMYDHRMALGREFGADGVEVSAHSPCAPDHQLHQGRRYRYAEWNAIQGSLAREFVTGPNCHHSVSHVIVGIGSQAYSDEELAAMRSASNETVEVTGLGGSKLSMTRYEATQYQRGVEREIRRNRVNAALLEAAGQDGAAAMANARAEAMLSYYRGMSASVGLGTRMERTKAYVIR